MESSSICSIRWWRSKVSLKIVYLILLGQLVSFILALSSFTSSLVADLGVNAPITQSSFNYFALALVYGSILLYRGQKLRIAWYWYLLLGFVDVQGNYLLNETYQFSSLTSVRLLDCWTVVWAIALTWFFLGTRYLIWQLFGSALCVLGLGLVILSDAGVSGSGTICFACSSVGEEFCVKNKDRLEVVSMIGLYGLLVSVIQLSVLEVKSLESVTWSTDIVLALAGYTVSLFLFYTLSPFVLKLGGATMFNLSILTTDMWAVVFRILFYHQEVDWLYFVAFAVVYSATEKDPQTAPALENVEYQVLNAENSVITYGPLA